LVSVDWPTPVRDWGQRGVESMVELLMAPDVGRETATRAGGISFSLGGAMGVAVQGARAATTSAGVW
jgi:hypothetical protein